MPEMLFGNSDIAVALGVGRAAVSNWLSRYDDTPVPIGQTPDGRLFWDRDGLRAWLKWHDERREPTATKGATAAEARRRKVMKEVMRELRSEAYKG